MDRTEAQRCARWDEWGRNLTDAWWYHMGWDSAVCLGDGVTAQELWSSWEDRQKIERQP